MNMRERNERERSLVFYGLIGVLCLVWLIGAIIIVAF